MGSHAARSCRRRGGRPAGAFRRPRGHGKRHRCARTTDELVLSQRRPVHPPLAAADWDVGRLRHDGSLRRRRTGLAPTADEIVVVKRAVSAMATTDLERLPHAVRNQDLGPDWHCHQLRRRGTGPRGRRSRLSGHFLRDCCETWSAEAQRFSIEILSLLGEVITVEEFIGLLAGPVNT